MFKLHVIQAQFGDSLLIEYGNNVSKFILIDGGPPHVYDDSLRGELMSIVGEGGILERVVISHVDDDHIKGIVDFFMEMKNLADSGAAPIMKVKGLWHNSFSHTVDEDGSIAQGLDSIMSLMSQNTIASANTGIVLEGIKDGNKITTLAIDLDIPLNEEAIGKFFSMEKNTVPIVFENLELHIVGPTKENLDALKEKWKEWLDKQQTNVENGQFDLAAMSDKSVPNLSSIAFLAKVDDKTVLFTGDSRADFVYQGLKKRALLNNGAMHVNILKMPHHGSDRNINREFLENITADIYVISANGKYDNPDYATLTWIVETAKSQNRKIKILVTNETASTKKLLKDYDATEYRYKFNYIAEGKNSYEIKLL